MALSIGLSTPAELLLWDEPTNHLDIETIEKFEEELMSSNKSHLIISHDRYLLNHTTDRIFHIEKGQIITFNGTYLDYLTYLEEKEAELRKNLDKLENKHRRELAWMRQGIKARGTRSKKRVEGFQNIEAGIKEIKSKAKKVINIDLQHSGRKSKKLLEIKQGAFAYENKEIFHNLNLIVAKKDKIALIGPNGTGKSTLINLFQEKLKLQSGELRRAQELKIIVFDQHRNSLDPKISPKDLVGEGADFITLGDGRKKHIHSYLESFLFDSNQINRPIETLSGGEKNRLQLANFMKQSADLWVFDEPTNDLDIETIEILEKELKSYQAAVIIIGHDRAFLDNTCNTTWLINEQTIEVFEGGYTQVAPYLHAIEHEKKMTNIAANKSPQKAKQQKLKLSHSEKKRLKTIDDDIMAIEEKLGELNSRLSEFNFTDMTPAKMEEYNSELSKKEELQIELDELYQEWEELHSKVDLISQNT